MFTVTQTTQVRVVYLEARVGVRYWEDAKVNGVADEDGSRIPMRVDNEWCPFIDLETGVIQDWPEGTVAEIHYKVCDNGTYNLRGPEMEHVSGFDGYVPKIMCPGDNGFGDYIIMNIDGKGRIENWRVDLSEWD